MSYEEFYDEEEDKSPEEIHKTKERKRAGWQTERIQERASSSQIPQKFGLCSKCEYADYSLSKHGTERVSCNCYGEERRAITSKDPVEVCTMYKRAGEMNISTMWSIAYLIEPKKRQIGFIEDDWKEEK